MLKIFITGINGFIGRNIAAEALKRGYGVSGLSIDPGIQDGADITIGDIRKKEDVERAINGADYVIHLAAITSNVEFEKDLKRCYDINVNGFVNVLQSAIEHKCKRFIYASSAAVYVDEFSEDKVIDFGKQRNHYAKTKLMNEMIAQSYHDVYKIDTIGLRYFNVYGKGENEKGNYASIITLLMNANKAGKPLEIYGDGKQARDMINVSDVAKITLEIMEKGKHDVYNVGTGDATTYNTIADAINKDNKRYVNNPLSSYQYLTKADTGRLKEIIGDYKFRNVKESIETLLKEG